MDRDENILAQSLNFYSVFADPPLIKAKEKYAQILSQKLNLSRGELLEKLSRQNRRFVWLQRKINWRQKKDIESLNLTGIGFVRESQRFYPEKDLFPSLLGIVDIDNNGLEGIEFYYDHYLQGKQGWVRAARDAFSERLVLTPSLVKSQPGSELILNLDSRLQYWVRKYLKQQVDEYQAMEGSVVVMDAESGRILSLANYKNNLFQNKPGRFQRNSAVTDMFEPGSVFKVLTLVAAIAEGVMPETVYCESGSFRIPGSTLGDWRPYGDLSFEEVFYKSSNIGVAKIAAKIGHEKIYRYIKKFGFGKRSGIDFPGETKGKIRPLSRWSRTSRYIIPIGQEIGVNILQLARLFAVVANGGYLVTPHLAQAVCAQGVCKQLEFPKEKILPQPVADKAKEVLIGIVEEGTGQRAKVSGYAVGGKTGTAQKFDVDLGRYSPDRYKANFAGFVAGRRPVVIVVAIDEPKISHFGGVVAAPLFSKIAEKVINYRIAE